MKIALSEQNIKENFDELIVLGVKVRHPYNNETRTYNEEVIEGISVTCAGKKLDEPIVIAITKEGLQKNLGKTPNVKKWGKIKPIDLAYEPSASGNSFEQNGKERLYGKVNDKFTAEWVEALTPQDKLYDNKTGEIVK